MSLGAQLKRAWTKLLEGSNGDLWSVRGEHRELAGPGASRNTEKVKAHAQQAVLEGKVDPASYIRNALADAAADTYAHRLSYKQDVEEATKWETYVFSDSNAAGDAVRAGFG